jgi:hypothetical protein
MHIIQITSAEKGADPAILLTAEGTAPLGWCAIDGPSPHHLLVPDAAHAIRTLLRHGVTATKITPPLPVTKSGILWWKAWRDALPLAMYVEFRSLHHESVRSGGSLVRIQTDQTPAVEPWRVLAEAGVDIRCEFNCSLPTGREVHVLVPDPDAATLALHRAGVAAAPMDYVGPRLEQGIAWWGEWEPGLAYARRVGRPILLSFASPRVEQVPGVW